MDKLTKEASHILIVDDDDNLRSSLKIFLANDGYGRVSDVASGEEALEIVRNQKVDLIISDIIMKGISGIELLRQVRGMGLQCPVVMITGYPTLDTLKESKRLGAFDYIEKPVKKDDILRVAEMALQHQAES